SALTPCHIPLLLPLRQPPRSPLFPSTTLFRSTAAAHFTPLVDAADLDGAALTVDDPFSGATIEQGQIRLPTEPGLGVRRDRAPRSEEHTSELQSLTNLVCRLLLQKTNDPHGSP